MRSLVVAAVLVAGRLASAEDAVGTLPPLIVGTKVRLHTLTVAGLEGIVASIDEKTVRLATSGGGATVPIDSITRVETRVGQRRQWLKGLVIGGGLGLLAGSGWDVDPGDCEGDAEAFCSRGEAIAAGMLGYGAIGAGIGAVFKKDRWAPVDVRAGIARRRTTPPPTAEALPTEPIAPQPGCTRVM